MARDITSRIYGTPEDWDYIIGGQPDYGQITWHDTHWIYDPANGTGQEYNYPPEQSNALWGVRSDFAASAKTVSFMLLSKVDDVIHATSIDTTVAVSPEDSTPLIAYLARGDARDEPPSQWVSPVAQWAYDINTSEQTLAVNRMPDNPVPQSTLRGKSRAVAWLDRRNWVLVPTVGLVRWQSQQTGTIERYGSRVTLSELPPLLSQGWRPTDIAMGIYYVGAITPDEDHPRTIFSYNNYLDNDNPSYYERLWLMTDTTNDIELPTSLHSYYKQYDIPEVSPNTRVCSGDSSPRYSQAPFTAYGTIGSYNWPNTQGQIYNYADQGTHIGCYTEITPSNMFDPLHNRIQINIHYPDPNAEYKFDDVSYSWDYNVYDQTTGAPIVTEAEGDATDITNHKIIAMTNIHIRDDKGQPPEVAFMRAILHECASVGWWFAEDGAHAEAIATGSNTTGRGIYLPLLDEGITTGLYLTGEDIADSDQADMGDTRDIDYTPTPYPDVVPDGRSGDWRYTYNYYNIESNKYYIMDSARYNSVRGIITAGSGDPTHPEGFLDYNGINAGEWITTLRWYPINIPEKSAQMMKAGPLEVSVEYRWDEDVDANTYHLGLYTINESTIGYPDFRGFSMTKCYLRLPFYGDFELDLHRYYGYTVRVRAFVDFSSGYGAYYIESEYKGNWFLFDTVDFKIGYALPLNSVAMGTYQNQMHAVEKQLLTSKIALAGAVGTTMFGLGLGASIPLGMTDAADVGGLATKTVLGGGAGIVGAASKIDDAKYALEHTAPNPGKCLPGSPYCALPQDISPRIIFVYPKCASGYGKGGNSGKLTEYGKTTGFACIQQGKLSGLGLHGFTVISNARFNQSTGTGRETALIAQALSAGIII